MSRDPLDDNRHLPPWLRGLPLPPRPAGMGGPSEAAPPPQASGLASPPASSALPDWLREMGDDAPQAETSFGPPPSPSDEPSAPASSALPDWLREMGAETPPSSATPESPAWLSGEDRASEVAQPQDKAPLPEWLRDTQRDTVPAADLGSMPSWLTDTEQSTGAAEPPARADETPDWLRNLADDSASPGTSAPPDWLNQPSSNQPPAASRSDLPDWLRQQDDVAPPPRDAEPPAWMSSQQPAQAPPSQTDASGSAAAAGAAERPDSGESDDAGVPSWLRDISPEEIRSVMESDDEEGITAEPFAFEGASAPSTGTPGAGPPAWLGDSTGGVDTGETTPDWLKETISQADDLSSANLDQSDVPLWLQDLGNTAPHDTFPASSGDAAPWDVSRDQASTPGVTGPGAQESAPSWLQASEPAAAASPAEDMPSWLQASEPAQPAAEAPATQDMPAWLQASEPAAAAPPAEDMPAWLQASEPAQPAAEAPAAPTYEAPPPSLQPSEPSRPLEPSAPAPSAHDDLPEWLRPSAPVAPTAPAGGQDLPPWLRDDAGQPLPTADAPGDTNLPEWLRGAAPGATLAEAPDRPREQPPSRPEQPGPANLDWFGESEPVAATQRPPSGAESEFFGATELPAWLRPPEPEPPPEISPADARSLDWLTRLGVQDEEETVSTVPVPGPKLTPPPTPARTQAQVAALALLERLAAQPFPETAPLPAPAGANVLQRVGMERVLYLALLVALIVALVLPTPNMFGLATAPSIPSADALFAQLDKLSANDIVLVGYEWDARRSGELRPLEQAVLDHLIQRKVKLVLVSTDPQGTLLMFDFRDHLQASGYRPGGEDYILLGYRPGGELALRSFAQDFQSALRSDFQGNDATVAALTKDTNGQTRLARLNDFSAIVVLADEASDVQGWMEQVRPSARERPLSFLLPAETAPLVQPYLRQAQVYHLAGKQGALAYESLRGLPADRIETQAAQQRLGILVYLILFIVGGVAIGAIGASARRRNSP